ncbi:SHOCT domain-containing protein [Streptomyces sp. NRRL S-378]|uniref:SHOCT domain-containing protein n=1 Tax=Streptomyces sp. NRRL S-378 TaxID=1463904 RepID=UPI0004C4C060|nr:SHOCT domain-containing protein [Streptomyces sp. NRRL S-378]
MFIRPMGVTVHAANRPAGSPLLRGLLARASGAVTETSGAVRPDEPRRHDLPPRAAGSVRSEEPDFREEPEPELMDAFGPEPMDEPQPEPDDEPEPVDALYWDTRPEPGPAAPTGLAAELRQLADLAREGLLTPQEFTTAKARLLNG